MTTEPDAERSTLVDAAVAARDSTEGRSVEAARFAGRPEPTSINGKVVTITASHCGLHTPGHGRYGE